MIKNKGINMMTKKFRKIIATVCSLIVSFSSINLDAICKADFVTTEEVATTNTEIAEPHWGDANCDGEVSLADAVLIMRYMANPSRYGLGAENGITKQGLINGDVYENGTDITCNDALSIQKYIIGVITQLPESYKGGTITTMPTTTTSTTTTTTTTSKPTTTTSTTTTTTTTSKPTTTSTTTTTTTTSKSTTTSTTTTTTATSKPTSTSTTTTTTTTSKPTTTSTTTTTTTTSKLTTTTTTTTTSTANSWNPPKKEDLVYDGEQINERTYNILINTAKLFGVDKYKIVWSDHPIAYAYTDPGSYFCMRNGIAYGYGVQVAPSSDITKVCPDMKKLKAAEYKANDYICYRPLVADDNLENVLKGYEVTESGYKTDTIVAMAIDDIDEPTNNKPGDENYLWDLKAQNLLNAFEFVNWYLIPIDDDREAVEELNYPNENYNASITAAAEVKYWFTNEELTCGGPPIVREIFYDFIFIAEQFGIENFKIVYNTSKTEPIYYSFTGSKLHSIGTLEKGCVQIVYTEDITRLIDLEARTLKDANGDEKLAKVYYEDYWLSKVENPMYYWAPAENDIREIDEKVAIYFYDLLDTFDAYVMIPLDETGNEDLRLWNGYL